MTHLAWLWWWLQKCSIWSLFIAPPGPLVISLSLVIKFDAESGSDGRLTPEVKSLCEPRPPPCEPEITFEESVGDWLVGAQPRRPQELSLWSSVASTSPVSKPDIAKIL